MRNSPENEPRERPEEQDHASDADQLSTELERLEDRYKRALADLDNYRKRSAREVERLVQEARASVIGDWLEALDSVERAMRMEPDGPCFEGLRAVLDQMEAVLAREGVLRIGAAGDRFDPERHEAVAVQPSEQVPDRTILSVERSGFALGDRMIRPAQVVVARTPEHVH
jgi:molecular chaperone GrpE